MNKFTVTIDGKDFTPKYFTFPDGQPHVEFSKEQIRDTKNNPITIRGALKSGDDVLTLIMLVETMRSTTAFNTGTSQWTFECTYLLGARMDRIIADGHCFTLSVTTSLINQLYFGCVKILEPHSAISLVYTQSSQRWSVTSEIVNAINAEFTPFDVVVCPDKGAKKLMEGINLPIAYMEKDRESSTGKLTGFRLLNPELVKGKRCLIVDDICDGGGTFVGSAKLLIQAGADNVQLYVTHGIFSKGLPIHCIDHIWTTNSYYEGESSDYITVFDIDSLKLK